MYVVQQFFVKDVDCFLVMMVNNPELFLIIQGYVNWSKQSKCEQKRHKGVIDGSHLIKSILQERFILR